MYVECTSMKMCRISNIVDNRCEDQTRLTALHIITSLNVKRLILSPI